MTADENTPWHQLLLRWTRNRPMKQIDVLNKPYLQRYFIVSILGYQIWLHRFLRYDGEPHFHSHPWNALSIVLCGNYRELWLDDHHLVHARLRRSFLRSLPLLITRHRRHRIGWALRNTWTLMIVGRKRQPHWFFYDTAGQPTRQIDASPGTWWQGCEPRAEEVCDV